MVLVCWRAQEGADGICGVMGGASGEIKVPKSICQAPPGAGYGPSAQIASGKIRGLSAGKKEKALVLSAFPARLSRLNSLPVEPAAASSERGSYGERVPASTINLRGMRHSISARLQEKRAAPRRGQFDREECGRRPGRRIKERNQDTNARISNIGRLR